MASDTSHMRTEVSIAHRQATWSSVVSCGSCPFLNAFITRWLSKEPKFDRIRRLFTKTFILRIRRTSSFVQTATFTFILSMTITGSRFSYLLRMRLLSINGHLLKRHLVLIDRLAPLVKESSATKSMCFLLFVELSADLRRLEETRQQDKNSNTKNVASCQQIYNQFTHATLAQEKSRVKN